MTSLFNKTSAYIVPKSLLLLPFVHKTKNIRRDKHNGLWKYLRQIGWLDCDVATSISFPNIDTKAIENRIHIMKCKLILIFYYCVPTMKAKFEV